MIDRELHAYLDGERGREELPPAMRTEADRWEALFETVREDERTPPWLEGRVMHAVWSRAAGPWWQRALRALLEPRVVSLRLRPAVVAGAALAVLVAVGLAARRPAGDLPPVTGGTVTGPTLIQFVFEAPHARSVSIAGSFNSWAADAIPLSDPDGDGVWTALVPLEPGVHEYMFLVDGVEWVADPRADRFVDDGFGRNNAVVTVPSTSRVL